MAVRGPDALVVATPARRDRTICTDAAECHAAPPADARAHLSASWISEVPFAFESRIVRFEADFWKLIDDGPKWLLLWLTSGVRRWTNCSRNCPSREIH